MSKSIEHSPKFHMVRRIARTIAPDFRVLARAEFSRQESCLDLTAKTIEVSEKATDFEMVGAVLFHLGHLRLRTEKEYAEHFGEIKQTDEKALIEKLSLQGARADKAASAWAREVFLANFNVTPERVDAILSSHIWNEDDWTDYYSS